MEKALFITKYEDLKYFNDDYSRLYFGNEFCENLLPNVFLLKKIISKTKNFTLVTPYMTDKGIEKTKKLLKLLKNKDFEVVFNDYGILESINENNLTPILGRILTRQKRGPRIMNMLNKLPKNAIRYFRKTHVELEHFQDFLLKNNIKRIEFDNVLQGIDMKFSKLKTSLYVPYVYVSTTRLCLANNSESISKRKEISITQCNRECAKYTFELNHKTIPTIIYLKGNTQFYENKKIPKKGFDRLIIQPRIPI